MAEQVALSDLSLFPATREQAVESRKRTFVQWGTGRTLEEYLRRDELMEEEECALGGNYITWVLAPRDDPATLDFMCSCETFRRSAIASLRGTSTVSDVTAYGVASVYTPPANRRRGYAQHMMRLVHWLLRPRSPAVDAAFPVEWGAPPDTSMLQKLGMANATFSVLYSDVGRDFYNACGTTPGKRDGWATLGAVETYLSPAISIAGSSIPEATSGAAKPDGGATTTVPLSADDVVALYAHDAQWVRADLARSAAAGPQRANFTFLPDAGVGAFVVRRTMGFMRDADSGLLQAVLPYTQWGVALLPAGAQTLADALTQAGEKGEEVHFITWTIDTTPRRGLVVARTRADSTTFPVLLDGLLEVARREGCGKAEFWYLPDELRALVEGSGWTTAERTAHLSAVKWYGEEGEDELEWLYNEEFCWC